MAKKVILKDENLIEIMPITRGELILDSSGNPAFTSELFLATPGNHGLLSASDKKKIDEVTTSSKSKNVTDKGWYRIAISKSSIYRCLGTFEIDGSVSGYHTVTTVQSGINYGANPFITALNTSHFVNAAITKVRIVYHTSYTNNYAYLEVYKNTTTSTSLTVKLANGYGWSLCDITPGSVPTGYDYKELSLDNTTLSTTGNIITNGIKSTTGEFAGCYNIKIGKILLHTPVSEGWYSVAKVEGYFNYNIYISGGWNHGKPSVSCINILNLHGDAKIIQLSGNIGELCNQIRLCQESNESYIVQLHIPKTSGNISELRALFAGYGTLTTYETQEASDTDYDTTNTLMLQSISGIVLTTETNQTITGAKTFDNTVLVRQLHTDGNYYGVRLLGSSDIGYLLLGQFTGDKKEHKGAITGINNTNLTNLEVKSLNTAFSGNIVTNTLVISNKNNAKHILFSRGTETNYPYNYIAAPAGGIISILPNGVTNASTNGMLFSANGFHPATTQTYALGTIDYKWSSLYTVDVYSNTIYNGCKIYALGKEIVHADSNYFELNKGYSNSIMWLNAREYKFNVGSSGALFMIATNGNVGIGDVGGAPAYKLHVGGGDVMADTYYAWFGGFRKNGSSDSYLLLGGGGHKAISDFLLKTDFDTQELSANLKTITKSIKLTKDWQYTGISINPTEFINGSGTYIVLVYVNNGEQGFWLSYFSGIMSIYTGVTNGSNPNDEIILHHASHACSKLIYLKTKPETGSKDHNKLYIACNTNCTAAINIVFKFKKLI